ncbi:DUF4251 domain-containing protein [uncultured Winogradskyella sp.]|uniref:DUF4251 domain-containing protein n=1 Tax=uncultured Winogradskyella sp. TaxID=395353 RepID=UPI0035156600
MKRGIVLVMALLTISAGLAQEEKPTKRELKDSLKDKCFDISRSMLLSKRFKFTASLMNTDNNVVWHGILLNGDYAEIDLPFMGQEFTGSGYGARNTSISFKGEISNYKLKINQKKKKFQLGFTTKLDGERIKYSFDVDACGFAYVNVQSDKRSYVIFDGPIRPLQ